jgi:hypothetical protein
MFTEISYYPVLGLPLIVWGGAFTLLCLLITAGIQVGNMYGITKIPLHWHKRMAGVTIILGLLHGIFALLSYI